MTMVNKVCLILVSVRLLAIATGPAILLHHRDHPQSLQLSLLAASQCSSTKELHLPSSFRTQEQFFLIQITARIV